MTAADYQLIVYRRPGPPGVAFEEVRRATATPELVCTFYAGDLFEAAEDVDTMQVRVELVAPDGAVIDTYTGPHPDAGPELFRQVATAGRRSVANVWAALIGGADPGPVPEAFDRDLVEPLRQSTGGEQ